MAKRTTLKDAPKAPPPKPRHDRKHLTESEWRRLLGAARADGLRSSALMLVMYETGMRREEPGVMRLSYAEDLHKNMLYVFRGKGSVDDRLKVTDVCRDALLEWIDEVYPQKKMRHGDLFIFPGKVQAGRGEEMPAQWLENWDYGRKRQKGLSGRAVYNLFNRLADAARIPGVVRHPHVLKHSRVQHILNAGFKADISPEKLYQSIAKIVGHATARTTIEQYSAASGEEQALVDAVTEGLVK